MENKVKIILIRHGQSLGNLNRIFLGHTDLDLSDLGYRQAKATAEHLKNEKIDLIYSSDLIRAYNTALPHAEIREIDVISNKNLREAYVGAWENMNVDEIITKWGRGVFEGQWKNNFGCFTFPGGESTRAAGERMYNEIINICNDKEGQTVLISSHAAIIRSFWAIINDVPCEKVSEMIPFPTNASYSICYYENGKIAPFSYSNDGHLVDVGITKVNLI
jgi:broad specificity phosphatase PhoE